MQYFKLPAKSGAYTHEIENFISYCFSIIRLKSIKKLIFLAQCTDHYICSSSRFNV